MKIEYIQGKKTLHFAYCYVVEESDSFYGIYRKDKLLTHRPIWKQATKIASLIAEAWKEGHESGWQDCEYAYEMDESYQY